jgi:hypothetical protein
MQAFQSWLSAPAPTFKLKPKGDSGRNKFRAVPELVFTPGVKANTRSLKLSVNLLDQQICRGRQRKHMSPLSGAHRSSFASRSTYVLGSIIAPLRGLDSPFRMQPRIP